MDVAHCGGILARNKIAAIAVAQELRIALHYSVGQVALADCLYVDAGTPNFTIQGSFGDFDIS
jgi:L-alanine-DL-glutamate epimerase-like enolase superfamily enzyme